MASALSDEDVQAIIALPKFWHGDLDWKEDPPGSDTLFAKGNLTDADGATIPGLTVELTYLRRGDFEFECNDRFTVFKLVTTKKQRAFQVEVCPADEQSHIEPDGTKYYGPHEHVGERYQALPENHRAAGCDHQAWFYTFLTRAAITFQGDYVHPQPQSELDLTP